MNEPTLFRSVEAELYVLFQALIALILGGVLGWEREVAGKWAGLRTHMLVCLAAMLFIDVGKFLIFDAQLSFRADSLRADPTNIIAAIVTGISFLGAGTVFRDPDAARARGLTTAASLLVTGPIGIAVALGRYVVAIGATLLVLFVLRTMQRLERRLDKPGDTSPLDAD